jgi:AraC family L-rhamnose operon transcriptional activator RhaR
VAVADRYPQNVFAEHTHEFCELVLVWRGNGLHVLNDRPWRITRGDLFYIRAEDKHSYASVNDLVLQNIIYCPERLQLNFDWAGRSRPLRHPVEAPLAHGQHRYGAGASGD